MVQAMTTPKKSYSRSISRAHTSYKISRQASFFELEDTRADYRYEAKNLSLTLVMTRIKEKCAFTALEK